MSHRNGFINNAFLSPKDEERSQATARLIFVVLFYGYFLINIFVFSAAVPPLNGKLLITFFGVYPFIHYLWVNSKRGNTHFRRSVAVVLDVSTVTAGMYYLDWSALYVYPLYLWIIFGNGIRFGSLYLFASMALSIVGFGFILQTHPLWVSDPQMGRGLMGILVIMPLFFLVMIKRLQSANSQLKEQLELRKQQEAIMIQQSRNAAMGEMIGNIAHQWRQPLNALSLLLQNIIFSYETGRLDEAMMSRVNEKGNLLINSMSNTIDDFRNFFKPNRSKEIFNISFQLEKTLEMVQSSLDTNLIRLEKEIDKDLQADGFPNEFSQVLLNLINNAKDALNDRQVSDKTIRIAGRQENRMLILSISDNAGGIDDTIMDKIFDPYFTTKDEGKGTGIGLYMSKVIIENNMHGTLSVINDAQGAVFTITMPVCEDIL